VALSCILLLNNSYFKQAIKIKLKKRRDSDGVKGEGYMIGSSRVLGAAYISYFSGFSQGFVSPLSDINFV
jgi:hypothetical protein